MNTLDCFIDTFVSRRDDFALQRSDGGYVRVGRPLALQDVRAHLTGAHTLGSYVIDEHGNCRYAVFDADSEDGLDASVPGAGKDLVAFCRALSVEVESSNPFAASIWEGELLKLHFDPSVRESIKAIEKNVTIPQR